MDHSDSLLSSPDRDKATAHWNIRQTYFLIKNIDEWWS